MSTLPTLTIPVSPGTCTDGGPQTVTWKGRMWQRCDDGYGYNWEGAKTYCQNLVLGGYSDWRLPSKDELKSLVVCTNGTPTPLADYPNHPYYCGDGNSNYYAIPTIDSSFQCSWDSVYWGAYWSSTAYDADIAWSVNFHYGFADWRYFVNYSNYVRCVR